MVDGEDVIVDRVYWQLDGKGVMVDIMKVGRW